MSSKKGWIIFASVGVVVILVYGIFSQIINFNNRMISLQEMKKAEIETTKVEYGQCIIKILETNKIAKSYNNDVLALATKAGSSLNQFQHNLIALIGTQIIPQLSPSLRENVQREIISCRNAYIGRVDLGLKPMYIEFNQLQRQFPYSVYNGLFYHWQTEELNMPKEESVDNLFEKKTIQPLDLN